MHVHERLLVVKLNKADPLELVRFAVTDKTNLRNLLTGKNVVHIALQIHNMA